MTKPVVIPVPAPAAPVLDKRATMVQDAIKYLMMKNGAPAKAVPTPVEPPPVIAVPTKAKKGTVLASSIMMMPPDWNDFQVTIIDPATIPAEIAALVQEVDPLYLPDPVALIKLLHAWEMKDATMISGPTGSGKSELVRYACAITGRPYIRINMTGDAESSVIFGTMSASGGSTVWNDGPATEAVRYGAVLMVDEWTVTPPDVAMGFQWLLENGGKLFLKEMPGTAANKIIHPHVNARYVFNDNTLGQGDDTGAHSGTQVQNTAMIDRMLTCIRLEYMAPASEEKMLQLAQPKMAISMVKKMVSFAGLVRTAYKQGSINLTLSPRCLLCWAAKFMQWGNAFHAIDTCYGSKLRESDRKIVTELYKKVFGS